MTPEEAISKILSATFNEVFPSLDGWLKIYNEYEGLLRSPEVSKTTDCKKAKAILDDYYETMCEREGVAGYVFQQIKKKKE